MALYGAMSTQEAWDQEEDKDKHKTKAQKDLESVIGGLEVAAAVGTGTAGQAVGGLLGLTSLSQVGLDDAVKISEGTANAMTYVPRSERGQEIGQNIGNLFAPVDKVVSDVEQGLGNATLEKTESPELATLAHMGPSILSELPIVGAARKLSKLGKLGKEYEIGDISDHTKGPGGKQRGLFAGINAKGADLKQLKRAQNMDAAAFDPADIWYKTGWWNDGGDWKWEIDDSRANLDFKVGKMTPLSDALGHPEFKHSYGEIGKTPTTVRQENPWSLKNILYEHGGTSGWFEYPSLRKPNGEIDVTGTMTLDEIRSPNKPVGQQRRIPNEELKSTLLHEAQHAIQEVEGWEGGGSPESSLTRDLTDNYNSTVQARQKAFDALNKKNTRKRVEAKKLDKKRTGKRPTREDLNIIKAMYPVKNKSERPKFISWRDTYYALKGEMESRLVEKRMNLTKEERRKIFPEDQLETHPAGSGSGDYQGKGIDGRSLPPMPDPDFDQWGNPYTNTFWGGLGKGKSKKSKNK
jgi:hypothetical protein